MTPVAVTRSTITTIVVILLNSLLLTVFIVSALCYKDVSQYAAEGGDPLGIIFLPLISFPSLIVLGILLLGFKNRLQIPIFNGLIPFIGILALYLPLLFDIARHPTEVGLIGVGAEVILGTITVVTTVVILVSK